MRKLRALLLRLKGLFLKSGRERDLSEELESHLQMHIDDNISAGMSPQEARRVAVMKLGGVDQAKEAYRDRATIPFLESLVQDLRFTIRQLRKNPAFTVTATAMVALGRRSGLAMGGRGTAGKVWTRVGSKLVVLELTTAMVLLVGAGLLGKSFYRLLQVDAGFETKHLIAVHVSAPPHCERSDYPVHPEKNPVNPVKPTCGPDLDRSFDRIYRIFFRMDRMDQNLWNISSDISVLTSNIL